MVDAQSFPGWDSFAALVSHLEFVRDHHRLIGKIAAVSDSPVLSLAPRLAKHFVKAEIRHFNANERAAAWPGFASKTFLLSFLDYRSKALGKLLGMDSRFRGGCQI